MDINFILPVSIVLGLLSFSLIAKWYLMPLLALLSRRDQRGCYQGILYPVNPKAKVYNFHRN